MPKLEIQSPDGQTELRRLSRRSPIVVGRNPISDVCVDEESVAPIHCRVSWNGSAFEVAAVAETGVDVNGVLVRRKELTSGDVIQVGGYRLAFRRSRDIMAATAAESAAAQSAAVNQPTRGERRRKPEAPAGTPGELNDEDWAALSGESAAEGSRPAFMEARRSRSTPTGRTEQSEVRREATGDDDPVLLDEVPQTPRPSETTASSPPAAKRTETPVGTIGRLRDTKRPGDQDILTSPLVLGVGGLSLLLLLAAGTFWLLMDREAADRLYGAAVADREAGRYAQSIRNYEQFLLEFPTDERSIDARFALGLTRIERYAGGSSPDFEKARTAFEDFVRGHRDLDGFDAQREPLRKLARQMTVGASDGAIRTGDRKLLNSAEQARQLFDRYAPTDGSVDDVRRELTAKIDAATAAVRKREFFDAAATVIDAAIAKNDFTTAFSTRSDLLTRYPDLAGDKRVRALLAKSLDAEKSLVKSIPPVANDAIAEEAAAPTALTLVGHTQARAGEVSDGQLVFAVARDSLIGLDAVTGRPRWRSSIGLDTPFFPVAVNASVPALIVFDATRNELMLLRRNDGSPIWRTPVGAGASGPPLVAQGQIDLTTVDGRLVRFVLETGEAVAAVQFPQPVIGSAVLTGEGERLVVFGDQATAYTLDLRSLAVQRVSFTGQARGAIDVPPQSLGKMVLVCENDRLDSSVVRAFTLDAESGALSQVASERIEGLVREPPVARGNLLFAPSSSERITPLSVSDDAGQPPLTRLGAIQIPKGKDVPTFLVPGPDGMLWAAGSALRKLRLVAKGLELLPDSLAEGRHTQPPQVSGESLFVARSLPSASAIYVSQADREAMTGSWRTVLGAAIVAAAGNDNTASVVTEAGQTAIVSSDKLKSGGFLDARPLSQWNEDAPDPINGIRFDDGSAAVWRGGASPLLWLLPAGGSPGQARPLPATPECPPIALEGGLVLPLPGRLEWLAERSSTGQVEAFLLAIGSDGKPAPKWRFAARIDPELFAIVDDAGTLRVIRLRPEPLPHLAEVASLGLDAPPSRPLDVIDGRIAMALDDRVQLLDPSGLRTIAEVTTEGPVTGGPWAAGKFLFVQNGSNTLVACDSATLTEQWRVKLDAPVAGRPLSSSSGWVFATQTGTVVELGEDGTETNRTSLETPLTGLISIGETVAAMSLDGSLSAVFAAGATPSSDTPEPATDASASEETAEAAQ